MVPKILTSSHNLNTSLVIILAKIPVSEKLTFNSYSLFSVSVRSMAVVSAVRSRFFYSRSVTCIYLC